MYQKISENISLGQINSLVVDSMDHLGFYLMSLNEDHILLPRTYVTERIDISNILEVFVYNELDGNRVCTTIIPKVKLNEFAFLEVIDVTSFGAFVDIGLPKDLLVPNNKQKNKFHIGESKFVKMVLDEQTNRLIGVEDFSVYLKNDLSLFELNDEVEVIVFAKTDLGFKVIVNNDYEGLIYHNEIFGDINLGDIIKAYIKKIREDNKLDICLQKIGSKNDEENLLKIKEFLKLNNGFAPYNYKTNSDTIHQIFSISKKNFKSSLTQLIETKQIELLDDGIQLLD